MIFVTTHKSLVSCRKFHLHLSPNEKIFAKDFHAYALDRDGKSKEVLVDKRSFYNGFVEGKIF